MICASIGLAVVAVVAGEAAFFAFVAVWTWREENDG